jgi:hypothetical protein
MRNLFLTFVLMLVAGVAGASDSGLYYDELRNGEGILLLVNGETYVMYMFTYGATECELDKEDDSDNGYRCDNNGQRWFYGTDEIVGDDVGGALYATTGINYPMGEEDDLDPFVHNVGKNVVVGKYLLRRTLGGWRMDVAPVGDVLDKDDFLFEGIFEFRKQLFEVNEAVAEPK